MNKHFIFVILLLIYSCSETVFVFDTAKRITLFGEKRGQKYKIGNPYQINGKWFYPEINYDYDQVGMASWYGPNFHGKKTANGERFDQNKVSAAHKTLPMPTIVKVINLENNKELIIRINDRGPFVDGRIIDLSKEAAKQLGVLEKGVAKVRVVVQELESRKLAMDLQNSSSSQFDAVSAKTEKVEKINLDDDNLSKEPKYKNKMIIQVGSFKNKENANTLIKKLQNFNVFLQKSPVKEDFFYRVRIGPFNDFSIAKNTLKKLFRLGFKNSKIIPNYE